MEDISLRQDRGYEALERGDWNLAGQIFSEILEEDPRNGMACLGSAMAVYGLHGRNELAAQWEHLRENAEFMERLKSAKPDFLPWLQQDLESITSPRPRLQSGTLADSCRRPLLLFAAVQVGLYLAVTGMFMKIGSDSGTPGIQLLGSLFLAAVTTGLPVILGPVYGNSIVEGGRFCRVLKLVNKLVCIPGSLLFAVLTAAGCLDLRAALVPQREDVLFTLTFFFVFLTYFLSLVIPPFLRRKKESGES